MERGSERVAPRPRRAAAEWRRLAEEQSRSGRSVAAFAAARGLSAATLRWWKSELRRRGRGAVPAAAPAARFVEVLAAAVPPAPTAVCEAALPNGVVLRFPADVDPARLGRLLAAAGRPC